MMCPSGKQPFDSRRQLKRWLRRKGFRNRVYRCGECGMWHHTSQNHRIVAWYREHA